MSSSNQNKPTRKGKGKGRQKVNLAMIDNENNRQVTFSKRRAGVFKKASELTTLCGAEAAIVVFSPGNKAYSFGHPNVDAIANRFLGKINGTPRTDADRLIEAHRNATISQHVLELNQVERELELEKKRGKELERQRMAGQIQLLSKLDEQELGKLTGALLNLRNNLRSINAPRDPQTNPNPGTKEIFQSPRPNTPTFNSNVQAPTHFVDYGTKGKMSKGKEPMVPNQSSGPVLFDAGASGLNALLQTAPRPNNLEVRDFHEAMASSPNFTTPYDPMGGNSDIIIPYCSDAGTPTTDPQSVDNFSNFQLY